MGSKYYPNLFSPCKIGNRTVKNRIVMAPMSENMANADGSVSEQSIAYFTERAKGGAGIITVGIVAVEYPRGKGISNANTLDGEKYIKDWERLARNVHRYGALLIPQIQHSGANTWTGATDGELPVSVSESEDGNSDGFHVLTKDDIKMLEGKFISAAVNAQMAGCDGVEVHSATTYLLSQFINPAINNRKDEYGGSIENRTRMARNIIKGIREACGPNFIIGSRIPVHKWDSDNLTDEESVKIAQLYEEAGVDYLSLNAGYLPNSTAGYETGRYEEGDRMDVPAKIMGKVGVPVFAVGMLKEPEMCEQIIKNNHADFVVIGRSLIADPFWPEKAKMGKACEIRNCLSCLDGCFENLFKDVSIRCAVNPEVGYEFEKNMLQPSKECKKVLVIGGGVAGMQAAVTACERGHNVTLIEKSDKLGGQLNLAEVPPYKRYITKYKKWFTEELERKNIEIRLNTPFDEKILEEIKPDEIIVASGAVPKTVPVKGIEKAVQSWDVLSNKELIPVNKKVVIIGGGIVGCETALLMKDYNNEVTILEALPEPANGLDRFNKEDIISEFNEKNIIIKTSVKIEEISENKVKTSAGDFEYDLLISATGQKPFVREITEKLDKAGYNYVVAGDAERPGKIINATLQGYMAGINI